jgi:hypothetical protein
MRAATGSAHHRPNSMLSSNPASNIADKYVQNSVCLASACMAALPRARPTFRFARESNTQAFAPGVQPSHAPKLHFGSSSHFIRICLPARDRLCLIRRKATLAGNLRLAHDHYISMARAATKQGIQGAQHSEMFRNRQKSQRRENRQRHSRVTQTVEKNHVTRDEYGYSQRRQPTEHEQAAVSFHGFDPSATLDAITRGTERPQEQSASRQLLLHHCLQCLSPPPTTVQRGRGD